MTTPDLSADQLKLISDAAWYLENPSWLMEIANLVGKPLEFFTRRIDQFSRGRLEQTVNGALRAALSVAVYSISASRDVPEREVSEPIGDIGSRVAFWHKMSVAMTGSAGGLFGIAGLAVELPITTTIMMRSIASVAQEFGEDLSDPELRLQCLSVFCLGGPDKSPDKNNDAMESAYLTSRLGLQAELTVAARAMAGLTAEELSTMIQKGAAPAVVRLLGRIAGQFNVAVTEKMIAQAIPLLGAVTGATINVAFMGHFNRVARFHFGIRSLERQYGAELIQSIYRQTAESIKRGGGSLTLLAPTASDQ